MMQEWLGLQLGPWRLTKMNQRIKALFLDCGGVLLTNGWDHTMRKKAVEVFHLEQEETSSRHALLFDTYEIGKISRDDYLATVMFYEPRSFTRQDFKAFMFAQSKAHPDMIQLVQQLKSQYGLKLLLISNEGRELMDYRIQTFHLT